jgi:hypothetical protein
VFVAIDPFGLLVLLLLDGLTVLFGQVAVVLNAHASLFFVDAGFLMFESAGFAGGELAALDALSDAVLLVFLALVDGWRGVVVAGAWAKMAMGERRGSGLL